MRASSSAARQQVGYILPFVLVLLVALMVGSMSFFNRANDSTQLSGASKDYDQAMLLAESGGDWVMGRFFNLTSPANADTNRCAAQTSPSLAAAQPGDLNCNGALDDTEGKVSGVTPTLPLPLGYEYYLVDAGTTLRVATAPGILQMIADGEARNTGTALADQTVLSSTTRLLVNNLFVSSTIRPILLTQGATGLAKSANTWDAETSAEKAAVWLEVTREKAGGTGYDLYLCSIAKVGNAKAYLQRYIGTYGSTLAGIQIAPLSESANHG
ncbi:MAG: hypothetical protein HZC43_01415 [Nitrosomonadales bacterium]|nr:hypothetical protein [Nitrosomonadales bacterium]